MKERELRIASSAQKEMADIIRFKPFIELKNPILDQGIISIVNVLVEKGHYHMRFFLSIYQNPNPKLVLEVLELATPRIRGEIGRRLKLRMSPNISFHLENGIEKSMEVENILRKINE